MWRGWRTLRRSCRVVVDIGPGDGWPSIPLAAALPDAVVVGVEPSPRRAGVCAANAGRLGVVNASFVTGVGPRRGFVDASRVVVGGGWSGGGGVVGECVGEEAVGVAHEAGVGVAVVGEADEGEGEGPAAGAVPGGVVDFEGGAEGGAGFG